MASVSVSSPAPVAAETDSTLSKRSARAPTSSVLGRSDLLTATIRWGTVLARAMAASSSAVSSREPSSTSRARDACFAAARLRSTPMVSTASPPSRMPAVSMSRRSTPPTVTFSSTVSRVVPAMSVTIARS